MTIAYYMIGKRSENDSLGLRDNGNLIITEVDRGSFILCKITEWCETIYSRKMNLDYIREEKLKELGI